MLALYADICYELNVDGFVLDLEGLSRILAFLRGLGIKGFGNIFFSDVTRCNCWRWEDGQMKDVVGGKWGDRGISAPDLIVKVSLI